MSDPKQVYLEPVCPKCWKNVAEDVGRMWCEDDVWGGDDCPECGDPLPKPTRYVPVDDDT